MKETAEEVRYESTSNEKQILARIKNAMARANHPDSNEFEARAAIRMSVRLMNHYDMTMGDVIAYSREEDRSEFAAKSVVRIKSARGPEKKVSCEGFSRPAARAMSVFFDCKTYSTRRSYSVDWTFYGIAQNTVSAANAFEMVYNKIALWATKQIGVSASYSYSMGVARGLQIMAEEEKERELKLAEEKERSELEARIKEDEARRQRELDRLNNDGSNNLSGDIVTLSSDDEGGDGNDGGFTDHGDGSDDDRESLGDIDADFDARDEPDQDPGAAVEDKRERIVETRRPSAAAAETDEVFPLQDALPQIQERMPPFLRMPSSEDCRQGFLKKNLSEVKENQPPAQKHLSATDRQNVLTTTLQTLPERCCVATKSSPVQQDTPLETPCDADEEPETSPWTTKMQLVKFRENAQQIAENWLKERNMKLRKPRNYTAVKDQQAFRKGKKDSRKIDVHQRRLKGHGVEPHNGIRETSIS